MKPFNPITDFKVTPIRFGSYHIHVQLRGNRGEGRSITINLSEYFGRSQWDKMSAVDQHNWLDNFTQDYAESITTMGWSLGRNV